MLVNVVLCLVAEWSLMQQYPLLKYKLVKYFDVLSLPTIASILWMSTKVSAPEVWFPITAGSCPSNFKYSMSHGSVVVSKHGLYGGGLGSIPTAITTMTAAGGDAEHVSLNH